MKEEALGGPGATTSRTFDTLNIKLSLSPLPGAQQSGCNFIGAQMPLPYTCKSFMLSSLIQVDLFWAFKCLLF